MIGHLLLVPTRANAENEPARGKLVDGRYLLGGVDWITLDDETDELAARVFAEVGVYYDVEASLAVREFRDELSGLRVNAARMLHVEERPHDEVIDYVERWGLNSRERAASSIDFLVHPTWRAYASCYTSGLELCRRWVGGDAARFRRLLTEQFTTKDLEGDGHAR